MSADMEKVIAKLLPGKLSNWRRAEVAEEIADELTSEGLLFPDGITAVEVPGARVPVETVDAYGLTIAVDANGNAVRVSSPWGLEAVE